jgi:hypothetical protein
LELPNPLAVHPAEGAIDQYMIAVELQLEEVAVVPGSAVLVIVDT